MAMNGKDKRIATPETVEVPVDKNSLPTFDGVPRYFQALCWTAAQGGISNYKNVGRTFAAATEGEQPYGADNEQWQDMLGKVRSHIKSRDRESIWKWYSEVYPRAMRLIPRRKQSSFVDGVLEAYEEGELWFL